MYGNHAGVRKARTGVANDEGSKLIHIGIKVVKLFVVWMQKYYELMHRARVRVVYSV